MSSKTKAASKFAAESAAASSQPSEAMIALFQTKADVSKLERRNAPMLVKPDSVPVGGAVTGEIIKILDSPVSTIKGKLLWLRHESGTEFTFPCTGVIRNALCPGVQGEDKVQAALEKEIGKKFFAVRQPNKPSKYKKEMFMFDVYTQDK